LIDVHWWHLLAQVRIFDVSLPGINLFVFSLSMGTVSEVFRGRDVDLHSYVKTLLDWLLAGHSCGRSGCDCRIAYIDCSWPHRSGSWEAPWWCGSSNKLANEWRCGRPVCGTCNTRSVSQTQPDTILTVKTT